jgi:hypothetical protein
MVCVVEVGVPVETAMKTAPPNSAQKPCALAQANVVISGGPFQTRSNVSALVVDGTPPIEFAKRGRFTLF